MRALALAVVAAGVLAATAAADVPAGFTAEPVISARAAYVAGKPVSIACATTQDAWSAELAAINDTPPGGISNGVTPQVGGDVAYLAPQTCDAIHARLSKQAVNLLTLGAALDVLAVESLHLRGEVSDGQTACDALKVLPWFLVKRWDFRNHSPALGEALLGAREYHAAQGAPYAGPCG